MVSAESRAIINKDSVGSSTEVSQSSVVGIIANQTSFMKWNVSFYMCISFSHLQTSFRSFFTAVSYIYCLEGCKSLECNSLSKDIWEWARERNIWLSAAHIPRSSNVDAGKLSRNLYLNLEWMLSLPIFQRIVSLFGKPDVDLSASRLNAQVETYVSWWPQPMAKFVGAFSIEVSQFFFYTFPRFCLTLRCVQKIIHDQASGILVIPRWTTEPFFTVVLHLVIEMPRVLKASAHNLVHPTLDSPHPLHQRLGLLVCKLSGNPCKTERFHQTLLKSSFSPRETVHTGSTKCTSKSGYSFVVRGHMIHCIPLWDLFCPSCTVSSRKA